MNKQEFKEKWLKGLRSGEYKQGKGQLRTKDGKYCCLGVAAVVNGMQMDRCGEGLLDEKGHFRGYNPIAKIIGDDNVGTLYQMNDSMTDGKTFEEIADWIEKNI